MKRRRIQRVASSAFCHLAAMSILCRLPVVDRQHVLLRYYAGAFASAFSAFTVRRSSLVPRKKSFLLEYRREGDVGHEHNSSSAQIIGAIWGSTSIDSIREQLLLLETITTTLSDNEAAKMPGSQVSSVALRRFTQLLSRNQSNEQESGSFEYEFLPSILDIIETSVKASDIDLSFNVLTDTLVSFSFLVNSDSCATIHAQKQRLVSLARYIWTERLQKSAKQLVLSSSPGRMTYCLQASLSLQFVKENEFMPLFEALCERLVQGDVLSRLTPFQLASTLVSLSHHGKEEVLCRDCSSKLITAFARRLRKQSIRSRMNTSTLIRTIAATNQLARVLSPEQNQGDNVHATLSKLIAELNTATYTLIKEISKNNSSEKMRPFTASEAVTLLDAVDFLGLYTTNDPILLGIHARLWRDADTIIESASLRQVALLSRAFLHRNSTKSVSLSRQVGDKLMTEFNARNPTSAQLEPWIVSSLVRYAVLTRPQPLERSLLNVYQTFVRRCILEPAFLTQTNAVQISNFCWFMYSTRWDDEAVVHALAQRTLETDLQSSCTPKIACRLLYMFTGIFETQSENAQTDEDAVNIVADKSEGVLSELFRRLGEHLLSTTNLSPHDLSSAIDAYAKASYVQDLGIFDHLIDLLASRMDEATTRQLAQSLWACGKMVGFEAQPDDKVDTTPIPPYYSAAFQLARHLSCNADRMTTKDVAQSLWSLGRLKISDKDVAIPMIHRAQELAKELNTHEVSNILWAMSRIRSNEYKTIFALTRRFALSGSTANASSQEAANILCSLGRLNIRDEDIFRNLSHVIMKQIDETSAQGVANVLWAHRTVHLEPPQELLNRWANEKLGIIPVQPKDS